MRRTTAQINEPCATAVHDPGCVTNPTRRSLDGNLILLDDQSAAFAENPGFATDQASGHRRSGAGGNGIG